MCLCGCTSDSGKKTKKQGAGGAGKPATGTGTSNGGAAATCAPFVIKSETVATTPGARTRTRIGIGEEVNLKTDPSTSVTWTIESDDGHKGTLSSASGTTSQYTACDRGKTVKIKAESACGRTHTRSFDVVQPSGGVFARITDQSRLTATTARAAFQGTLSTMPADVNFYNTESKEGACPFTASGIFVSPGNTAHALGASWIVSSNTVGASGTEQNGPDSVGTGTWSRTTLIGTTTGTHEFRWPIPWFVQVRGGGTNNHYTYETAVHLESWTPGTRILRMEKAGSGVPLTVPP